MTNDRIEAAKLTDEEIATICSDANRRGNHPNWLASHAEHERAVANAATAKALQREDARRKALVRAVGSLMPLLSHVIQWRGSTEGVSALQWNLLIEAAEKAKAALKLEEEANG